uniref:Uncharacterized protein n=1 Tax=Meloidogyne incognita TaxID=6306 RepID=A0A914NFQ3_MELIC
MPYLQPYLFSTEKIKGGFTANILYINYIQKLIGRHICNNYPAFHLYIYRLFYSLTDEGKNIRRAQYIFAFYIFLIFTCFRIYLK